MASALDRVHLRTGAIVVALWLGVLVDPSAQAQPAQPAPQAEPAAAVKVHDAVVFSLSHPHNGKSAAERARTASAALLRAVEAPAAPEVRVDRRPDSAFIYVGREPIVELTLADAEPEGLSVYAAGVTARIAEVLRSERRRSEIAGMVLSASLAVFAGLGALYVLRKIGEFATRARNWTDEHPERITSVRLQTFEVIGPAAMRGGVLVGLLIGRWLLQLSVVYAWLVFTLSLFAATRPYTTRLTGFVLAPLSEMTGRLAASLPLLLLVLISTAAVYVLLRFVRLFFASVARGETRLGWLPADLAPPTSWLASFGIVAAALVFVAPMITGDRDGALAHAGTVVLVALGLALTPLFASGIVGTLVVFGRRLRVGQRVEVAGRGGRLREMNLLELRLSAEDGSELRVPHLLCLTHPLRVLSERPRLSVELSIDAQVPIAQVREVLLGAAAELGDRGLAELLDMHADAARYRVEISAPVGKSASDLRIVLVNALQAAGIALGRPAR